MLDRSRRLGDQATLLPGTVRMLTDQVRALDEAATTTRDLLSGAGAPNTTEARARLHRFLGLRGAATGLFLGAETTRDLEGADALEARVLLLIRSKQLLEQAVEVYRRALGVAFELYPELGDPDFRDPEAVG